MPKARLDQCLAQRALAENQDSAGRLVMAGQVKVNGQVVVSPSAMIDDQADIQIDPGASFVSRGGDKLLAALRAFPIEVSGRVCADVGASTGGFTDCLLQHGAAGVYAIDVGYGILHWKLRNHPRVVVMERTNARYVAELPEPVSLVTIDASFISIKTLLPVVRGWFQPVQGEVVALIKPQFEANKEQAARGEGVIHDPSVHREVLLSVLEVSERLGFSVRGLISSPLRGPKGNLEFLAHLDITGQSAPGLVPELVSRALN